MFQTILSDSGDADGTVAGRLRRFWRRQLDGERTRARVEFDVAFGIVLPVVCVAVDPFVFRGFLGGRGLLEDFQFFAFAVIGLEILTLGLWLVLGRRLGAWRGAAGGIMLAGALFSAVIGTVLLPFSLVGLIIGIGVLGFSPFFSAAVYLRNGLAALSQDDTEARRRISPFGALTLGAVFALGGPAAAQVGVSRVVARELERVVSEDREPSWAGAQALWCASWLSDADFDRMVWAYRDEADAARKARLARRYQEFTGKDIERRLAVLLD